MNYSNLTAEQQMVAEAKKFVNKKQRELTQAEYNALSAEEKNNGTIYFIIDSENPSVDTYTKSEIDELTNNKVDKVEGKQLSTNDYTNIEKQKLAGIEENAQANVQSDWNEDDTEDDGYIKNKPNLSTSLTATGNPITIESSESNLVECVAEVEAVQDLHGYDYPWVGGAGKNKLNYDAWKNVHIYRGTAVWENNGVTLTATGNDCFTDYGDSTINIPVTTGETITLTWDVQESSTGAGRAFIFGNGETSSMVDATSNIKTLTYEVPSGITFIRIRVGVTTNGNTISYKNVMVRKSGDSTFEPYSNISPITGQTEVVIGDVGKNLIGELKIGGFDYYGFDAPNNTRLRTVNYIKVSGGETISFSGQATDTSKTVRVNLSYYTKNDYITPRESYTEWKNLPCSIEIPSGINYIRVLYSFTTNNVISNVNEFKDMQIEKSTAPTTYEPYQGKTYRVEIGQKNKLPMTVEGIKSANTGGTWNGNAYTLNGGTLTIETDSQGLVTGIRANGTFSASTVFYLSNFAKAGEYVLNGCPSGGSGSTFRINYPYDGTNYVFDTGGSVSFTADGNEHPVSIAIFNGYTANNILFRPMIRTTIDDSEFAPYNPNLPDTIYGGELDVITGELRATHRYAEYDGSSDEDWSAQLTRDTNEYRYEIIFPSDIKLTPNNQANSAISNKYVTQTANGIYIGTVQGISIDVRFRLDVLDKNYSGINDVNAWKTYLASNPLQVVYELATPYTIQLTPQQIRLLKGTNHISCNTGDLSIKYYPDNVLGQLKGDIEAEYDERIETLETQMVERPQLKRYSTRLLCDGFSSKNISITTDKKIIPLFARFDTEYMELYIDYEPRFYNPLVYYVDGEAYINYQTSGIPNDDQQRTFEMYYYEV